MADIYAGYMGSLNLGGGNIPFDSANLAVKQGVGLPDVIAGTHKRVVSYADKIDISGSISGPLSDSSGMSALWTKAYDRGTCGQPIDAEVSISYYCNGGAGISFDKIYINSMSISCTAGDVAQFSLDFIGMGESTSGGSSGTITATRLITWDRISISAYETCQSFDVNIANNLEPVYVLGSGSLLPDAVVGGLQTITGSVGVYSEGATGGWASGDVYDPTGAGSITIGGVGITITQIQWHRSEPVASVGPYVANIPFTCTGA